MNQQVPRPLLCCNRELLYFNTIIDVRANLFQIFPPDCAVLGDLNALPVLQESDRARRPTAAHDRTGFAIAPSH